MKDALKNLIITVFLSKKGITWLVALILFVRHYNKIHLEYDVPNNMLIVFLSLMILLCITLGYIVFEKMKFNVEYKKS